MIAGLLDADLSLGAHKVPWTYAWSPSLLPKPSDWRNQIDIAGFYFLNLAEGYEPPAELAAFLSKEDDRPLIYIGCVSYADLLRAALNLTHDAPRSRRFGSVPVSDPAGMSLAIRSAIQKADVRALISVGWAGLSSSSGDGDAAALEKADDVFLLQDVPHDWLFAQEQVKACVHHGGAGTTAIGFLNGLPSGASRSLGSVRPKEVLTFSRCLGQSLCHGLVIKKVGASQQRMQESARRRLSSPVHLTDARAGQLRLTRTHLLPPTFPPCHRIPGRELTANKLAEGIKFALSPRAKAAAQKLGEQIRAEVRLPASARTSCR